MQKRLKEYPHESKLTVLTYLHGTHFLFPEKMLEIMLPIVSGMLVRLVFRAGREYPKKCRQARIDVDLKLQKLILMWQ